MNHQDMMTECKQLAWACRETCQRTLFKYCLQMDGEHSAPRHVKTMIDCIQICQVAADFITRESENHTSVCETCATICDKCVTSCEMLGGEHMQACANACRKCADMCRKMTGMQATA